MYSVLVAATAMIFCAGREAAFTRGAAAGGGSVSGGGARLVRVEGRLAPSPNLGRKRDERC